MNAVIPDIESRMKCRMIANPHPAVIEEADLLARCDLRTQRRSGPGGQHRNKTSSGAFLTDRELQLTAEATERRSQAQNRDVALQRLRFLLAIEVRTPSPLESDVAAAELGPIESSLRKRYRGHSLRLNENNVDKPALLALILNDLWVSGGQPSLVGPLWSVSTSKLVQFLRSHAPALTWVNRVRSHHDRLPLH